MLERLAHHTLDVSRADGGVLVEPVEDHTHARGAIALPHRFGRVGGAAQRGHLLARDDHDARGRVERIQHGVVRPGHIQNRELIFALGELEQRPACARRPSTRGAARVEEASTCTPDFVFSTSPLKNDSSTRCTFSRASSDRESRVGAEEERRVAVHQMQVDEQRAALGDPSERRGRVDGQRARADAALGADEREHLSARLGATAHQHAPRIASSTASRVSGSERHSFTPARMALEHELRVERGDDQDDGRLG